MRERRSLEISGFAGGVEMGVEKCFWDDGSGQLDAKARVVSEAGMAGEGGEAEA